MHGSMAKQNVAEQFVDILVTGRGASGSTASSATASTPSSTPSAGTPRIDWVHVRHEETAAFAAGAEAQLTGALAACAGLLRPRQPAPHQRALRRAPLDGPGARARLAHPSAARSALGYFQETHPDRLFAECSHYCELISTPSRCRGCCRPPSSTRSAARGVAVVSCPATSPAEAAPHGRRDRPSSPGARRTPRRRRDRQAGRLIDEAERSRCSAAAARPAPTTRSWRSPRSVKSPVGHALRGKEWIQYDNPFDVGMSGLLGYGAAYEAMHEADLLILLGTDFPYNAFLPDDVTIVQVDVTPEHLGRRSKLDLGRLGRRGRDPARR